MSTAVALAFVTSLGAQLPRGAVAHLRGLADETCVRQEDCAVNAWCHDDSYITWCANPLQGCPAPFCTFSGGQTTLPPSTPVPTPAPTTTQPLATTTPPPPPSSSTMPAPTTTSGGEACVRQDDCALSAWCQDPSYIPYCANPAYGCPTPYCVRSSAAPTTSPAPAPTSSTTPSAPAATTTTASAPSSPPGAGIRAWFTTADFAAFFPNIDNPACTGSNFFTHGALLQASMAFPGFANSGDLQRDRRELAAFLGQTSHETTGGWATAPGGPQAWGYCFKEEVGCATGGCTQYCQAGNPCAPSGFDCTCVAGQTYHGRGPVQLSWNYNYGLLSRDLLGDASVLLRNPSAVASNATLAYMAGIWFWMTPQPPKPSCHDVMVGAWQPSPTDVAAGRRPGYGMTTNIINGGLECSQPTNSKVVDRVEFYKRYAGILQVAVDETTLYCDAMQSYR